MYYYFIIALMALLGTQTPLMAAVARQTMTFVVEETHNGIPFKHITEIENGSKKESFFIQGKSVEPAEFEKTLLKEIVEETKNERKKNQEERIKLYETQYKARVKIGQIDLKQAIATLENELIRLSDERIKPFMVYQHDTLSSPDQVTAIKERLLPDAKKLADSTPETVDIKKITDITTDIRTLIPRVKETFITAVNTGINKADDTKLLKELLSLL